MNREIMLDQLMISVGDKQMKKEEYYYISNFLGGVNFLVFGTGHDSNFWRLCNRQGKTFFLENLDEWIEKESKDTFKVSYRTQLPEYEKLLIEYRSGIYTNLQMEIPDIILHTKWDVIFVDSPTGFADYCPGRMQSIFTAKMLSNRTTDIFVHDCDRTVEDVYTREMFTTINQLTKLRHLKNKIDE